MRFETDVPMIVTPSPPFHAIVFPAAALPPPIVFDDAPAAIITPEPLFGMPAVFDAFMPMLLPATVIPDVVATEFRM